MGEAARATAAEDTPGTDERESNETAEALERALGELREIARDLVELSQVKVERARAGMRAGVFNAGIAGGLYVAAIATTIVAAWFLIDGVAGGLGEWLGQAWAGRALAGLAALVVIAAFVAVARLAERRSNLERLKRKFPEDEHDRT